MKLDLKNLPSQIGESLARLKQYSVILFVLLLAAVYSFLILRVNSLNSIAPASTESTPVVAAPHIDQSVVKQLQQLQDNSVSVHALFDQARSNPFQE